MYKLFRNIHLLTGLFITPFLLIYAFSSLFIAHGFFDPSAVTDKEWESQQGAVPESLLSVTEQLGQQYGVHGHTVVHFDEVLEQEVLIITRPGTEYRVQRQGGDTLFIRERSQNFAGLLKMLHITAGFSSGYLAESLWGVAAVCTGLLLLVLLITGIVLWSYRARERVIGQVFLVGSIGYCTVVLAVLRFS